MRRVIAACFAICVAVAAQAEDTRQIVVTGHGTATTAPDIAFVTVGVTGEGLQAATALDAVSEDVAEVLGTLTDLGIDGRDLQTSRVSLQPVFENSNTPGQRNRRIRGYVASNSVTVRVRDISTLGNVMDAVVRSGANQFNGLRFDLQDRTPLETAAQRDAVADAVAKADVLASAAGVSLGQIRTITDQSLTIGRQEVFAAARSSGTVPIATSEVNVTAQVTVIFDLLP